MQGRMVPPLHCFVQACGIMRPIHIPLALACALIWGFVFVVISWGLRELPPLLFTGLRFASCAILLPAVGFNRPAAWRYILGIGLFLGTFQFGLLFLAMSVGMPAGLASLVIQSQAFFTVILAALLLGDRPRPRQIAGIILAFAGIAAIASELPGGGSRVGLALCLAAGMSWAVANMLMKAARATNAFHLMVWMSLVPPIPLALASWVFEGPAGFQSLAGLSATGWFAVLYNGWVATLLAFGIWSYLLKLYSATVVAPFSLLVPVFGMSFAALLLGEALTPIKLAAGVVILIGLAMTVLPARKGAPAAIAAGD